MKPIKNKVSECCGAPVVRAPPPFASIICTQCVNMTRKPVAYSDHYDTRPATLRFAHEPCPAWAEVSVPLFESDARRQRAERAVVRAAASPANGRSTEQHLADILAAVERLKRGGKR